MDRAAKFAGACGAGTFLPDAGYPPGGCNAESDGATMENVAVAHQCWSAINFFEYDTIS